MVKKTSLKDIAAAAGVSIALVSYVLNNKEKEERVSAKTAKKIREIAKKMNYQPNQVAKSLKSGKSLVIGLIVADISNPFFSHLARTIEDESDKKGYAVFFVSSDEDLEKSERLIKTLVNRQIDGLIIAPAAGTVPQLRYLDKLDIPFVLIDRYFKEINSNYVVINNFKATYQATRQLLLQGHKNIAFVRYKNDLQHTEDRFQGYLQALDEFGQSFYKDLLCEVEFDNLVYFNRHFKKLLRSKRRVDAVLFSTNTLSTMGLKALIDLEVRVPDDISIFCFDESESYDLYYCPVSYVRQPLEKIGRKAVQILTAQIATGEKEYQQVVLDADLVVRESGGKRER